MSWLNKEKIMSLLLEMVRQPSISGTKQEKEMSYKIKEILGRIEYFKENSDHLFLEELEDDSLERNFVAALFKGKESLDETIILMGHMDVVDILDYGEQMEFAFKPLKLTENFKNKELSPAVKKDLQSGNYLFGRGVSDMKAGQALQIALLQHFSESKNNFPGNILFLSVPDEETSSRGMVQAVPFLNKLKEKYNLNYKAVINNEPRFPNYPGDDANYIYTGSMGKSVVMFYGYGKETHVGDALSGLNGNLIISEVIRDLEGNLDFCERLGDVISPPPTCLKQMDYKRLYSAQIPHNAACYFNLPVIDTNPEEMLKELMELARNSFEKVLDNIKEKQKKYFEMKGINGKVSEWRPFVYSYKDFYEEVYQEQGSKLKKEIEKIYEKYGDNKGQQELSLMIVDKLHELSSNKKPKIVVGYIPPYYPSVITAGKDQREKNILETVAEVIDIASEKYDKEIKINRSFSGISDLSYFNLRNYKEAENYLKPNMPNWDYDYRLPIKEITDLNVPVVNISIYGKDAHKFTERLETDYSFRVLPELMKYTIKNILKKSQV